MYFVGFFDVAEHVLGAARQKDFGRALRAVPAAETIAELPLLVVGAGDPTRRLLPRAHVRAAAAIGTALRNARERTQLVAILVRVQLIALALQRIVRIVGAKRVGQQCVELVDSCLKRRL